MNLEACKGSTAENLKQTNISEFFPDSFILDTPDILYLYMHCSLVTFYIED